MYLLSTLFQNYKFIESKFEFKQWSFYKFINFMDKVLNLRTYTNKYLTEILI